MLISPASCLRRSRRSVARPALAQRAWRSTGGAVEGNGVGLCGRAEREAGNRISRPNDSTHTTIRGVDASLLGGNVVSSIHAYQTEVVRYPPATFFRAISRQPNRVAPIELPRSTEFRWSRRLVVGLTCCFVGLSSLVSTKVQVSVLGQIVDSKSRWPHSLRRRAGGRPAVAHLASC